MRPSENFSNLPQSFWAHIKSLSQIIGYTERNAKMVKIPTISDIKSAFKKFDLDTAGLFNNNDLTDLGKKIIRYFRYRANLLNRIVEPNLLDIDCASKIYYELKKIFRPKCPLPLNKQTDEKKGPAYFTCIINMIIEANAHNAPFEYNPRKLITVTKNNSPLRTLSRWPDGAFPNTIDPIAIWEIKEYYHTTTFGSRVADAVYESLLDGIELKELRDNEGIHIRHYLMIDSHYTWWGDGKAYLCRLIDMLNMGYVDEILFGFEVLERLPILVKEWVDIYKNPK